MNKIKIVHPTDLVYAMRDIDYGLWDYTKNKAIHWDDPEMRQDGYVDEHCYILRPKDVWSKQLATCWDATLVAYEELSKLKNVSDVSAFYLEYITDHDDMCTHTGATYKFHVKDGVDFWYWFEHFHQARGTNGPCFSKQELDELILRVNTKFIKNPKVFYNPSFDPGEILRLKGNITCQNFIDIARGKNYTGQYYAI